MAGPDVQPLQGMTDLCAPEIHLWQWMEARAREVMRRCGCEEVRTPVVERLEVFVRALGEGTDVVQKEMYAFEDRGGRRVALRPEGTAGVMRHAAGVVAPGQNARLFYLGPMFRAERPQAGRKRQFHQLGMESLGAPSPAADAECISALLELFEAWGLDGFEVRVHSRGLPDDQRAVREGLIERARPLAGRLCDDCRRRIDTHPLRLLDCKQPGCRTVLADLPPITQFMSAESRAYLEETMRLLEVMGIPARVDPLLIRGLDYYIHTIWEVTHPALGAQDALAGGGRYRIPIAGRAMDGVGFAIGLERVVMALQALGRVPEGLAAPPRVWIISAGAAARAENLRLLRTLRRAGIAAGMDCADRSMKAQMRAADRSGAPWTVIRGDTELAGGVVVLKRMSDGAEERLPESDVPARLAAAEPPAPMV